MDSSDWITDTTQEHQELKLVMTKAINNALGNAAKVSYLSALFTLADTAADTGATILVSAWTQDDTSDSYTELKNTMSRVLSENAIKGNATDNAKLEALFAAAKVLVTA